MRLRFFGRVILLCLVMCILPTACSREKTKNKYSAYSMDYFDTAITITGYEYTEEEFNTIADEALAMLGEYHRLYTIYHRFDGVENLSTVNELVDGSHRTVKVDRAIIDMLLYAKEMHRVTNGMMNVAMGSVLSLWHDHRTVGMDDPSAATLPPVDRLKSASEHTSIDGMVIDDRACTVTLTDPDMSLDVGAIAKGYATEQVARRLEEKGVTGYVLNVGGNVRTIGAKPDGEPWTVGIENPNGGEYLAYLELKGQSLVTSGSYQRFYYVDGEPYHHIIHPDTLMPAEGYLSVSVVCDHSGMADALSTALFCMSLEDGMVLIESLEGVEAMWVSEDMELTVSSGWNQYLKG